MYTFKVKSILSQSPVNDSQTNLRPSCGVSMSTHLLVSDNNSKYYIPSPSTKWPGKLLNLIQLKTLLDFSGPSYSLQYEDNGFRDSKAECSLDKYTISCIILALLFMTYPNPPNGCRKYIQSTIHLIWVHTDLKHMEIFISHLTQ